MSRDKFKKTEDKLYNYFNKEKKIATLNYRIEVLKNQIDKINQELKECDVSIEVESSSPGFEERVQTSCSGESAIEKQILNQAERLLKEQRLIRKKQFKNKIQINELERNNIKLRVAIAMLEEDEKKFIYFKYHKKLTIESIAEELNLSIRTAYRFRKKIIEEVIKLI